MPAIINEAEKLATYCKVLAAKVGTNWSKGDGGTGEVTSNNRRDKEADKLRVISCCRKLRKAVVTTRVNMKLLEKKIVSKFEQNYGNIADIDVDLPLEASSPKDESTPSGGKRLIVKIKNFREANSKQDYYAEVRESPPPLSANLNSVKDSPLKSACSVSSLATIPHCPSPLSTEEPSVGSDVSTEAETQAIIADENRLPEPDNSLTSGEPIEFFDTFSELIDGKLSETDVLQEEPKPGVDDDHNLLLGQFPVFSGELEPNTRSPHMFSATLDNENSDLEDSSESVPLQKILPESDKKEIAKAQTPIPSPLLTTSNVLEENSKFRKDTPSPVVRGQKPFKSKLSRRTPSSTEGVGRSVSRSSNEGAVINSTLIKATPTTPSVNPNPPSTPDLNEQVRQQLLKDSTDSDDSLAELKLSPRVKRTNKRCRIPLGLEDDPKLKAECAVVVNRITNLVSTSYGCELKYSTLHTRVFFFILCCCRIMHLPLKM